MSKEQLEELQDLVEGMVCGKLMDYGVDRKIVKEISHNSGAYVAGQLKGKVK